jgi:hypothetical protein
MNIAFISDKGGASKTTYTRIVAEYFKYNLPKALTGNLYSDVEKELIAKKDFDLTKLVINNVTNHEVSVKRYIKYFTAIVDIRTNNDAMFSNSLACKSDNKYISLYDIGADVYPLLLTYEKTTEGELFFNN